MIKSFGLPPNTNAFFEPPDSNDVGGVKGRNVYPPLPSDICTPKSKPCPCDDEIAVRKMVPVGGDTCTPTSAPNVDGKLRRQVGILLKQQVPQNESYHCPDEDRRGIPEDDDSPTGAEATEPKKAETSCHTCPKQENDCIPKQVIVTMPKRGTVDKAKCDCSTQKGIAPLRAVLLEDEDVITRRPLCQFTKRKEPGFCRLPLQKPIHLQPGFDVAANLRRPVGIMLNPELVGDSTTGENYDEVKFYPCKVKQKDFANNAAGFRPSCPKETSYQMDYVYRGTDLGRCQTYQFHTEKNICEFVTIDDHITPAVHFGRQRTDLKPRAKEEDFPPANPDTRRLSEYMASISKLGGEIFSCNLYAYARKKSRGYYDRKR